MPNPSYDYEVRCLGKVFAQIISEQSIEAAGLIAQRPGIQRRHFSQADDEDLRFRIRTKYRAVFPEIPKDTF